MTATVSSPAATGADELLYDRTGGIRLRVGFDRAMGWLLPLLFLVAILPILDLVYYVSRQGLAHLTWDVITTTSPYQTDALRVPILSTVEFMFLATALAVAFGALGGVATAEILTERWASVARTAANLLVGTPSVALGYFGYFAFVIYFGWGLSFAAGVLTMAFFMTPYVFRTVDLAFTSVPRHIRDAALGSGAAPSQYLLRVATPIAFPQILNGIFLAMAIGVGETAPVVLTTQPGLTLPHTWTSPVTFMTELIWANYQQAPSSGLVSLAWQAAFILLVVVVVLNVVVRVIGARYQKRLEGLYQ